MNAMVHRESIPFYKYVCLYPIPSWADELLLLNSPEAIEELVYRGGYYLHNMETVVFGAVDFESDSDSQL
jgi:hypothetical protein